MSQLFEIHPVNPQRRLIRQAAELLRDGALIAYPTDSCYAFGWLLDAREPLTRVTRLRQTDKRHVFTLVCRDLAEIATYARVDNSQYRLLRAATPGPYTFILAASRQLPRRLHNPRRKTVGIRVPDHPVAQALLAELDAPLLSSTLLLPDSDPPLPLNDAADIVERLGGELDLILDAGACGVEPSTVIDLTCQPPQVLRQGKGSTDGLL